MGDSSPNLALSVTITSGISSGVTYKFKYLGRNVHGDGIASSEVSILAATIPSTMISPTVTYTSLAYRISFT